MNPENTKRLVEAAPNLFGLMTVETEKLLGQLAGTSKKPFLPIAFGFECGNGWFELLLECATKLEAEILLQPSASWEHFKASQVKEKYGTLRFYMSSSTEKMDEIISEAEEKSAKTCEECGKPGEVNEEGWLSCLCEECRK